MGHSLSAKSLCAGIHKPCQVLFFVKFPQPGHVKTRLARSIGAEKAAQTYRLLAEANWLQLKSIQGMNVHAQILYDPTHSLESFKSWLGEKETHYEAQRGRDLGERLQNAIAGAFRSGVQKVLVVGSDTINLQSCLLRTSLEVLHCYDVVLGPAKDGGYYLIGMKSFHAGLFTAIHWSAPEVLKETVARIKKLQLSYQLLTELEDLDDIDNLMTKGGLA
ncbi:MAG: hypothetical protein COV74_06315 [Candidatus Omnitrophica bacterium CG11_big_fil_rev_8_21_14_0_20_45_26]|uniref:Glycosyltransferase n=1 Tax=Candidatus Abzuiibacterium crystallinum TaxID=1974748 RepID=A0A2H0LNN0_9BACT|nr:MAG: hypothetical protein COV74_06315 [Candidatus Omnitrophica bacterium CG11_big_fil_rev_8_21_14_0_20_45_26]PIW65658.1 MAG: hypothetical protein COW12_00695 [Candidatus Omnitrophica bacterium CG12_big_fil_rev_8_21_14_0_65_45_16]